MNRVLYACSTNAGKLREFALAAREFDRTNYAVEPLPGLKEMRAPEENGVTFKENACLKALYFSEFTGELVFSDDSGIEVDALGGAPGVYSARFAGPDATDTENNNLLLERLAGSFNRIARFVCVIALARSGQVIETFQGTVEGEILREPRGKNGFGYDPLFLYPPLGKSFAEIGAKEKLAVSHRGHALRKLFTFSAAR
ncbi:MAG: RdgB/HAM1 family non-canonical purine NTP pyrophosphatase [Acidobacteriaceae bacterium]|nr:RdgB/HAM1 family non-canonical purine NTP pyrophosphatase [Acidobacteriaceae bacterium]